MSYSPNFRGNTGNALAAEQLRVSAPSKIFVKAVMFNNLTTFSNFPLPFIPVGTYTFVEGDRVLYDGLTPGGDDGDGYKGSGVYVFHDNGDSTGSLTRAPDWALGTVIKKGTLFHTEYNDDSEVGPNSWLEINADATVGAGDILPMGYNYVKTTDHFGSSGTIKRVINLISTVNVPLTGLAPGTVVGGVPIFNFASVLLTDQTTPAQNGVYTYHEGPQTLTRRYDFQVGDLIRNGTLFIVNGGGDYDRKLISLDFFVVGDTADPLGFHDVVLESSRTPMYESISLDSTDITNQYKDLAFEAYLPSLFLDALGKTRYLDGPSPDFSTSVVGGKTRITFLNALATGGGEALIAGDTIRVWYQY